MKIMVNGTPDVNKVVIIDENNQLYFHFIGNLQFGSRCVK